MLVALAIVAVATAFVLGWWLGRAVTRPPMPDVPDVTSGADVAVPATGIADLLDGHRMGVVVMSPTGSVEYRNAAAESRVGTHAGVLLDEAIERHGDVARSGTVSGETLEIYGPPRTVLVVEARPIRTGGAVVFVEDISERRRIDQVRTDFVANISHELKTPVGAMSVLAETLEGERDPDTIARVVGRMLAEAQRASRTIDDLIELSRIELGGERSIEPITVDEIVSGALERVREMSGRRGIGVTRMDPVGSDGAPSGSVVIEGDRRQLISALGNLVENAVKYSRDGGAVQIRVGHTDDRVEIAVVDQGVGIPQRDLDRIFERFYRVDRARSRVTGGTGLGLSIVRHVATNHDGSVDVTSTEGEGSTFTLRLPVRRSTPSGDTRLADPTSEGDVA